MVRLRLPTTSERLALTACLGALLLVLAGCGTGTPKDVGPPESVGPNGPISWAEALTRPGERLTAEGPVASVQKQNGDVELNLGVDAPDPSRLVVIIPAASADAFPGDPEPAYLDRLVRVTGRIELRDGVATIVVSGPAELKTE